MWEEKTGVGRWWKVAVEGDMILMRGGISWTEGGGGGSSIEAVEMAFENSFPHRRRGPTWLPVITAQSRRAYWWTTLEWLGRADGRIWRRVAKGR